MVQSRVSTQPAGCTTGLGARAGSGATEPRRSRKNRAPKTGPNGLERWGATMVRRRWWVLGVWIVVLLTLGTMAKSEHNEDPPASADHRGPPPLEPARSRLRGAVLP